MLTLADFAAKALETQLASQRRRELLVNLSGTSDTNRLAEQILREAKAITIFMLNDKQETPQLEFSLMVNDPWISIRPSLTAWRKKPDRQFSAGAPGEHWPFRWIAVFLNQSGWSGNGQDEHAGPFQLNLSEISIFGQALWRQ